MLNRLGKLRVTRDTVLLIGGLLGLAHETLITGPERPQLIFAFLAMLGLVPVLRDGDRRRDRNR